MNSLQWIEISRAALRHNLTKVRSLLPKHTKILAMVKANAYGHGLDIVSPIIADKIDFFGVNTISEAITIRKQNIFRPILITGPVSISDINLAIKNKVSLSAYSLKYLKQISKYRVAIHLKINTGMNRLGISPQELDPALQIISHSILNLEGVYTHFHSSDGKSTATDEQLKEFKKCVEIVKLVHPNALAHCANTAAILTRPQSHLDMVRLGKGLYGLYPSRYIKSRSPIMLKPVLSWKTRVIQTREVGPNEVVGYSATYKFKKRATIGVLPIGYSDGYDRGLSNKGWVNVQNRNCPVIGRVSMNFTTIEFLPRKLLSNAEVELIGPHISAYQMAQLLDTISYEVISRINSAIPRIVVS